MRTIKENILGLLRFIMLLCKILPVPQKKYQRLGNVNRKTGAQGPVPEGPVVLAPEKGVFCPKCHVFVGHTRLTNNGTQLIQNGKVIITFGNTSYVDGGGKEVSGLAMSCPNGHKVVMN